MKFSGKVCLIIILKAAKIQGFTLSAEDTVLEKQQGGGSNLTPAWLTSIVVKVFAFFYEVLIRIESLI